MKTEIPDIHCFVLCSLPSVCMDGIPLLLSPVLSPSAPANQYVPSLLFSFHPILALVQITRLTPCHFREDTENRE